MLHGESARRGDNDVEEAEAHAILDGVREFLREFPHFEQGADGLGVLLVKVLGVRPHIVNTAAQVSGRSRGRPRWFRNWHLEVRDRHKGLLRVELIQPEELLEVILLVQGHQAESRCRDAKVVEAHLEQGIIRYFMIITVTFLRALVLLNVRKGRYFVAQ